MLDEEFDVLGEEALALLRRRFECMYTNRKNTRRSSGMCYRCGKHGHFVAECLEAMEVKAEHKHRSRTNHKHRSRDDQVRAEAEEEWLSQKEGASDGGRCERHLLELLLLFIELK
jgi:predicted ATP-dependent serine protease